MWRTVLSLALMFGAVAWSVFAIVVIFLIVPGVWEGLFGGGAVYGALLALAGVIWSSGRLMHLADRVLNEHDQEEPLDRGAMEADVPPGWREYSARIAHSKRWAFYRRTRQFERLAELEASRFGHRQEAAGAPPPDEAPAAAKE